MHSNKFRAFEAGKETTRFEADPCRKQSICIFSGNSAGFKPIQFILKGSPSCPCPGAAGAAGCAARPGRQVPLQGRSWERGHRRPEPHRDPAFRVPQAEPPGLQERGGHQRCSLGCGITDCFAAQSFTCLGSAAPFLPGNGGGCARDGAAREDSGGAVAGPEETQRQCLALALPALLSHQGVTVVLEDIPRKTRVK